MSDSDKVRDLYDAYRYDILKAFADGNTICHGITEGELLRDKGNQLSARDLLCMFTPCDTGVKAVYKGVEYFFNAA